MILDHRDNLHRYLILHPLFAELAAFLISPSHAMLPPGDHALGRDGLRCIAAAGETTPAEDPRLEYHRAHIDVHVVLEGREVYGYRPREACEEGPYDADADAAVLTSVAMDLVTVTPGYFVVFFPEDGHRSMLHREGDAEPVRKLVFKLPIPRPGGA